MLLIMPAQNARKREKISDRNKVGKILGREVREAKDAVFRNVKGSAFKRSIERLTKDGPGGLNKAGDACLEQAFSIPDEDEALALLTAAGDFWSRSVICGKMFDGIMSKATGHARAQLDMLPLQHYHRLLGRLPPRGLQIQSYNALLLTGAAHIDAMNMSYQTAEGRPRGDDIKGQVAELDVLLLLQRFGIREAPEGTWQAYPSLQSNDRGGGKGSYFKNRYDIAIVTDADATGEIDLSYTVQVKSNAFASELRNNHYIDSISVVGLKPHLALSKHDNPVTAILEELLLEQGGNAEATRCLDLRTEQLMDIIG